MSPEQVEAEREKNRLKCVDYAAKKKCQFLVF